MTQVCSNTVSIPQRDGLRHTIVRQFTPNWFAATMGTGMLALDLNQLPGGGAFAHQVATGLWVLNIGLFTLFAGLYALHWVLFPHEAKRVFGHSVMSMFFGTIPMGLSTIINGFMAFGLPIMGQVAVPIATSLWWVDVVLSVIIGIGVPFLMMTRQDHVMEKMTAVWLLPVSAAEVAAASGAQIIPHLANPQSAMHMEIISYALWAFSVPVALSIVVILLLRLVLHRLPSSDLAPSSWLVLGPISTGALGLLLLGADAHRALAPLHIAGLGAVAHGVGLLGGVILWGYGVWWLAFAVLATLCYVRGGSTCSVGGGMAFNLGWWGFTFPLGVYTAATYALAAQTNFEFFRTAAIIMTLSLATFWAIVAARTVRGAFNQSLFVSPCLLHGAIPNDALLADEVLASDMV